jgi:UDP-N-acetylglucosamine:LPS N-acetylglucosamine transferase
VEQSKDKAAWPSSDEFLHPRTVLLVGSSGGHLAQLLALRPWYEHRERHWVTFRTPDAQSQLADERVVWAYHPTTRNIPNLVRNLFLAHRWLRRIRPDLVVSTGAGVAVPFFVLARVRRRSRRIPTAYIEVYDRLDNSTLTSRLCRPFTSVMCVQWPEQLEFQPDAELIGPLL